jgi:hypothetical protein
MKRAVRYFKRSVTVDLVALRKELEAGVLTEKDRQTAEAVLPGACEIAFGNFTKLSRPKEKSLTQ